MGINTLRYARLGEIYECTEIVSGHGGGIKIILPEPCDGIISVGNLHFKAVGGICTIEDGMLDDGCYTPIFTHGSAVSSLDGFILSRGTVQRLLPSEEYIRELGKLCREIEDALTSLEERIAALEAKTEGRTIL